jgi:hypothetical protein
MQDNYRVLAIQIPEFGSQKLVYHESVICVKHLALLRNMVISEIGMTQDTCHHCSIEWNQTWVEMLRHNEWLGEIKTDALVYVSGPMADIPNHNHDAFRMMEHALKLRGARVFSPIYHDTPDAPYHLLLKAAVALMLRADEIVMLKGWQKSNGATLEHDIAVKLKYKINYEK